MSLWDKEWWRAGLLREREINATVDPSLREYWAIWAHEGFTGVAFYSVPLHHQYHRQEQQENVPSSIFSRPHWPFHLLDQSSAQRVCVYCCHDPNEPLKHEKHTQLSHLASCVHAHNTSRMTRTCLTSGVHTRGILGWAETLLPNRKKHLLNRLSITEDWSWLKATLVDSQKCFVHHLSASCIRWLLQIMHFEI